jgi:hypothetical protein
MSAYYEGAAKAQAVDVPMRSRLWRIVLKKSALRRFFVRAVAHQAVLIDERAWFAIHLPSLPQALAARADIAVVGMIVDESAGSNVPSRRGVEHGDVRLDAILLGKPCEVGRIAIASVGCQALGPEPEAPGFARSSAWRRSPRPASPTWSPSGDDHESTNRSIHRSR